MLHLAFAMIEAVGGVVHVRHHAEHRLQHRARLADFLFRRRNGPHVVGRLFGDFIQAMHVRLHGVDRGLALAHLLERARQLGFDRFPFGEPFFELRHALLREAQRAGPVIQLVQRRRQLNEPVARGRHRAVELARALFELLCGTRRLLAQLGHPVQMLRRFVQRGLFQLELLTQRTRAFGEALDIVGARLEPCHGGIDFAHPALRALDGRDGCRHELLDSRGLVGAGGQCTKAFVCTLHPPQQLAAPLIELGAQRRQLRQPLVEIVHHATAGFDLAHRLRQVIGLAAHRFDGRLQILDRRQLDPESLDLFSYAGEPRLGS